VSLEMSVVVTEQGNVMVKQREMNWYYRISDATGEVPRKPSSL